MEHRAWSINSRMTLWWAHKFDMSSMDGLHQLLCLLVPILVVLCDTSVGGDDMWWDGYDWLFFSSGTRRAVAAVDAKRQETRHCDVVPDRQTVRNWWWLRCLAVSSSSSCTKNETIGFRISTFDYKVVIPCILSCLRCWPGWLCQLTLVVSVSVRRVSMSLLAIEICREWAVCFQFLRYTYICIFAKNCLVTYLLL